MKKPASVIALLAVVGGLTIAVAGFYIWAVPALFPSCRTSVALIAGSALAGSSAGYVGYRVGTNKARAFKIGLAAGYAIVGATLVLLFSLFVILNIRGE